MGAFRLNHFNRVPLQQQHRTWKKERNTTRRKCGRLRSIVAYYAYQKPAQPIPVRCPRLGPISSTEASSKLHQIIAVAGMQKIIAVAGDRTRVARVTGGNTHHYTTTTWLIVVSHNH